MHSMIRVNVIAYNRDAPLAVAGVHCLRRHLPDAIVRVVDDDCNPMPDDAVAEVLAAGGDYVRTEWPRRGSLNGQDCVLGLLDVLADGMQDDDVSVKLDADTLLRSCGPLNRMRSAGADGFGSCVSGRAFCGLCYGFSGWALRRMRAVADITELDADDPEDMAMGRLAMAAGLRLLLERPWSADCPDARWTAYRWPTLPPATRYDQFDVITLGTVDAPRRRLDMNLMADVYHHLARREVTGG